MNTAAQQTSPIPPARLAGLLYLITIAAASIQFFIRTHLIVRGDAAATAEKILSSETLYRLGIGTEMIALVSGLAVGVVLYELLKPVNQSLALLAAFFKLADVASHGADIVNYIAPLVFLKNHANVAGLEPEQLQALALIFTTIYEAGFDIPMVFHGMHLFVVGYLLFKSTFFPRVLGGLLAVAGLFYPLGIIANFLIPGFYPYLFPIFLVPAFIVLLSFTLWLTTFGVNVGKWQAQVDRMWVRR